MSNDVMPFVNGAARWVFSLQMRDAQAVVIYCLFVCHFQSPPMTLSREAGSRRVLLRRPTLVVFGVCA